MTRQEKSRPASGGFPKVDAVTISRPALRELIKADPVLTRNARLFGEWLIDRLDNRGKFPEWLTRAYIIGRLRISASTFTRRMRELSRYFTRCHPVTRTGRSTWIRKTLLRVADLTCEKVTADSNPGRTETRRGPRVEVSTSRTGSRNPWAEEQERRKVIANWPQQAKARSDVPLLRPAARLFRDMCRHCGLFGHQLEECWL